jgi:LysR family transcriptional regulator, hydrogen peroxide-inducible genes activator
MAITLRQLRYLVALAEHGHFGRAAASVHVSQPALSLQIRALEDELGVALIERGPREASVTPAGREVLRRARRVLEEIRELGEAARWRRGLRGRLRLGVIPTVAPYLLPAALPLMREQNVALDLGVREAPTALLLEELRRGALDAVIVALPVAQDELVEAELFQDRFLLAGSARQIAGLGSETAQPAGLDPGRLLLLDDGHCLADQALAACALRREETRMDLRGSSLSTLCRLAEEGVGLTFVPEIAVRAETASAPRLALRRFATPEPRRVVGLVRRRVSDDDGWFGELAEVLRRAAQAELDLAPGGAENVRDKTIAAG